MLEKSEQHTPIQHAAKAVSRMTLADRYSGQDVRLQTSFDYAKALNSVAVTMSNEDEALKDELIIAVWLLGLYEVLHEMKPFRNIADHLNRQYIQFYLMAELTRNSWIPRKNGGAIFSICEVPCACSELGARDNLAMHEAKESFESLRLLFRCGFSY